MDRDHATATPIYSPAQRLVAVAFGLACHVAFAAGVAAMIVGLYTGMTMGRGPWHGVAAIAANGVLLAQFALLHSLLLSERGRRWLTRLVPLGLGAPLATTTYALVASLQLLVTFGLWSPIGKVLWAPTGRLLWVYTGAYAVAWVLLLRTMADAGLAEQTGFRGWGAVAQGQRPHYRAFAPRGTFRYVRQPVYIAFALTLWTAPMWTVDHIVLAVVWTLYCVVAPRLKEQRYLAWYGERFERYRSLVPYWVPSTRRLDDAALERPVDRASS